MQLLTCLQTVVGEEVARKQCQALRCDHNMEDTAKNMCTVLKSETEDVREVISEEVGAVQEGSTQV